MNNELFNLEGTSLGEEDIQIDSHETVTIDVSEYTTTTAGSIYFTSNDDFVGYMAHLGNNGAGFSVGLAIEFSEILYAPDMRESDQEGLSVEGFHGSLSFSNPNDYYIEDFEGFVYKGDGSVQNSITGDFPGRATEPEGPDSTVRPLLGSGKFALANDDFFGMAVNTILTPLCANCWDNCGGQDCSCEWILMNDCDGTVMCDCGENGCDSSACEDMCDIGSQSNDCKDQTTNCAGDGCKGQGCLCSGTWCVNADFTTPCEGKEVCECTDSPYNLKDCNCNGATARGYCEATGSSCGNQAVSCSCGADAGCDEPGAGCNDGWCSNNEAAHKCSGTVDCPNALWGSGYQDDCCTPCTFTV